MCKVLIIDDRGRQLPPTSNKYRWNDCILLHSGIKSFPADNTDLHVVIAEHAMVGYLEIICVDLLTCTEAPRLYVKVTSFLNHGCSEVPSVKRNIWVREVRSKLLIELQRSDGSFEVALKKDAGSDKKCGDCNWLAVPEDIHPLVIEIVEDADAKTESLMESPNSFSRSIGPIDLHLGTPVLNNTAQREDHKPDSARPNASSRIHSESTEEEMPQHRARQFMADTEFNRCFIDLAAEKAQFLLQLRAEEEKKKFRDPLELGFLDLTRSDSMSTLSDGPNDGTSAGNTSQQSTLSIISSFGKQLSDIFVKKQKHSTTIKPAAAVSPRRALVSKWNKIHAQESC